MRGRHKEGGGGEETQFTYVRVGQEGRTGQQQYRQAAAAAGKADAMLAYLTCSRNENSLRTTETIVYRPYGTTMTQ